VSALHTQDWLLPIVARHWTLKLFYFGEKLPVGSAATQSESQGRVPTKFISCTTVGCFQITELQKTVVLNTAFCCNILPRDVQEVKTALRIKKSSLL
jgi:hypothetical protein